MNRLRAIELNSIINAFANGFKIEFKDRNGKWQETTEPSFTDNCEYRIKPQKKLVPFTFEDNLLFRDKWIVLKNKFGGKGYLNKIVNIQHNRIGYVNSHGQIIIKNYDILFQQFEFEDGSPCGKYIEE